MTAPSTVSSFISRFPPHEIDLLTRRLVDAAPVGFACFDLDLRFTYINETLAQLNGVSALEHIGRHVREIVPALLSFVEDVVARIQATGEPVLGYMFTGETPRAPGVRRHWSESWYPLRDSTGAMVGYGAVVEDVTERERALESMREAMLKAQAGEQTLAALMDNIPEAIALCDAAGKITMISKFGQELLGGARAGMSIEEVAAEWSVYHPDGVTPMAYEELPLIRALQQGQVVQDVELVQVTPRGEKVTLLCNASPIRDSSGRISGAIVARRDITNRREAEAALRRSEALYRAIGESIDYGIWVCDSKGRNSYASESLLKLVGITQEQCADFGWADVLHPDDVADTIAAWQECVRTGGTWYREHRYRGVDGQYHPILACGVPVRAERGIITNWAGINLDISRLKRTQEALIAANAAKDMFLAQLSHELRTPLTPVVASLSALARDPRIPEDLREDIQLIQRNIGLEVHLINDLLDMSRIVSGKLEVHKQPIDAAEVLREVARIVSGDLDARNQSLVVDVPRSCYWVDGDRNRLNQVFWNLITNAIKFSPEGASITVGATVDGGAVRIIVSDAGEGIDPSMLPRLFRVFEQGTRMVSGRGGMGLGLAICRGIVEAHGGTITAYSEGRGKGAAFTVALPLVGHPAPGAEPAPAPADQVRAIGPLRILLVEDHADTARMMGKLLEAEGHRVTHAPTVAAGLQVGVSGEFDVLMSDLSLPDGDGYDLMQRLVAAGKVLRGIAVSGHGSADDIQRSLKAGFAEHIIKPVDFITLHRAVMRVAAGQTRGGS